MKHLLPVLLLGIALIPGCTKKQIDAAPAAAYVLTDHTTSEGISVGDDSAAFRKAYRNYTIQVAYHDLESNYLVMSIDRIPYEEDISTLIANFFIDDKPRSEASLCSEHKIQPAQLHSLLSSPDYLREHDVVYRYLQFRWHDSHISEITSDELNYNETYETPKL